MTTAETKPDYKSVPSLGSWKWREDPNQPNQPISEYVSHAGGGDRVERRRRQADKQRAGARASAGGPKSRGRPQGVTATRGEDLIAKRKQARQSHQSVEFHDIKDVAFEQLEQVKIEKKEEQTFKMFELFIHSPEHDEFLVYLLNFFDKFYHKIEMEKRINPMHIEPSLAEKQAIVDAGIMEAAAQKQLGRAYCSLVMGLGMSDLHHMRCGQSIIKIPGESSAVSNTGKDREMYEFLYLYWQYAVWICFRKPDFEQIGRAIGRILRSDTFNPSIRVKNFTPEDQHEFWTELKSMKAKDRMERVAKMKPNEYFQRVSPAEYRRQHPKRPAINSITTQRSPALVSIVPSSNEESEWLFRRKNAMSMEELSKHNREEEDVEPIEFLDVAAFRVGIIGEPMAQYNPLTLSPLSAEQEEDETDGDKKDGVGAADVLPGGQQDIGLARQATALSSVTQEALPDDE